MGEEQEIRSPEALARVSHAFEPLLIVVRSGNRSLVGSLPDPQCHMDRIDGTVPDLLDDLGEPARELAGLVEIGEALHLNYELLQLLRLRLRHGRDETGAFALPSRQLLGIQNLCWESRRLRETWTHADELWHRALWSGARASREGWLGSWSERSCRDVCRGACARPRRRLSLAEELSAKICLWAGPLGLLRWRCCIDLGKLLPVGCSELWWSLWKLALKVRDEGVVVDGAGVWIQALRWHWSRL